MRRTVLATVTTEVVLDVDILASAFAGLSDDEQAQFFTKVAAIADATYEGGLMGDNKELNADFQWSAVGRHLVDCKCATRRGREMVRSIFEAMEAERERAQRGGQ